MNYYERHIGDYLKDTAHLSLLEHGVYGRALDVYYSREGAIPADQVERLIGARSKEERAALSAVLAEFFVLADGAYTHQRCERELSRYREKQRKASASANARWSKQQQHTERNADAMRTHSEGNAPTHQTPVTSNQTNTTTHTPVDDHAPAAVCVLPQQALDAFGAMRLAGIADGHAGHPDLLALVTAGAMSAEFQSAAADAVGKGKGFAYAIGTLKRQRINAASSLAAMHKGPMPAHETPRQAAAIDRVIAMTGGILNARERRPGQVFEEYIDAEPAVRAIR
jgi:uncharacterized protein YdaU (DUF1376 family)